MIKLHFTKLGEGCPLIVLHGLYGSGTNWHNIGKALSSYFTVYLLDQRNHGESPHDPDLNYEAMTDDLREFMDNEKLDSACLLGHSMGGKVAMNFALNYPDRVDKLVVIDIALRSYREDFIGGQTLQSTIHQKIVRALSGLDIDFIETREEADKQLARDLPQRAVRQFLLKNLKRKGNGEFYWGLNLEAVKANLFQVLDKVERSGKTFGKPVLVINGSKSGYITEQDKKEFRETFPAVRIEDLDAGHWVHVEQPEELIKLLTQFLTEKD